MGLNNLIEFKGTKKGIIIQMDESVAFAQIIDALNLKLETSKNFFKGAKVIGTEGRPLHTKEESMLAEIFSKEFGMLVTSMKPYVPVKREEPKAKPVIAKAFDGLEEGMTKFVRGTLRSGRSVEFEGNVVILGDINPGAEVIAYGNIAVFGSLRGVAHAGADGNESAWVVAQRLQPTQLRIGSLITRSPDDGDGPTSPEIAYVKDKNIMIEPYL
ncbi:septum site-determining protein MinC [Fusibacter sp. JL216-2]|uniref:septum site-determining protein MinC n=1 Tax=Fusibacter sp. JL216-2 TaxID=3071453 RepID=UPI003D3319A5